VDHVPHTDKKEKKIFLIFKEIRMVSVAKSYMRKGFLIYEKMRQYSVIYGEAVSQIWLCNRSRLNSLMYGENSIFFFISTATHTTCGEKRKESHDESESDEDIVWNREEKQGEVARVDRVQPPVQWFCSLQTLYITLLRKKAGKRGRSREKLPG
jgi:hypothetical protein